MDVKKQEYMFNNDKNINKLWTEIYKSQQNKNTGFVPDSEDMPFQRCNIRQSFWNGKATYFVITNTDRYDLNVEGISSKFHRYVDQARTQILLSHMKGMHLTRHSSKELKFQLLTIHEYNKLKYTVLIHRNNKICVREPSQQSSDGQVGSWLANKQQRDISCSIWKDFV